MSRDSQQGVVQLPSAGVPADHGLSSLGLIMQLGGSVFAAGAALFTFASMFEVSRIRAESLWMFLALALCIARSIFHRMAGTELLYGRSLGLGDVPTDPLAGVRRYIGIGLVHSVVFALLLKFAFNEFSTMMVVGIAVGLAAWPLTLGALLMSGMFKQLILVSATANTLPVSEDKGFEGAAILMTVLGVCGVLATGTILVAMYESTGHIFQDSRVVILLLALLMLVVRSCLHIQAGVSGLRETSIVRSSSRIATQTSA